MYTINVFQRLSEIQEHEILQLSSMTGCTEFPSPCEAFQKHPSGPSGLNGQEQHWMEHQACVQNVLALCCHLYHGFALAITDYSCALDILTRKQRMSLWSC